MGKAEQSYRPIRNSNDDEESSAHTSMDILPQDTHSNYLRVPSNKLLTRILLLLIILTVSVLGINLHFLVKKSRDVNLQDGLYTQLVPSMPVETVVFKEQHIYASAPNAESDKAWEKLLPPGRGYVFVKDGQNNGLQEPGEMTPFGEIYSVTVFHQIHCLGMLRGTYWDLLDRSFAQDDLASLKKFAESHIQNSHVNHCFDYLRQSLQCAADMSLEWPVPGTKNVDGWGVPHLCKSWDSVMDFMDANHFNASKRTDIGGE